jgi:hypothetical protein
MIDKLSTAYPHFSFIEAEDFVWSPETKSIHYDPSRVGSKQGAWSLLHETGHAIHNHTNYEFDIDLLKFELEAWEKAKEIASQFDIVIDQDYIEDNLDSYRDWLKRRSTCPDCSYVNLQTASNTYNCFNCGCSWKVSVSQVCMVQRRKVSNKKPLD